MASMPIDRPKRAPFVKARFLIFILATLCPVVCYMSRQNLSIAIVAMVKNSSATSDHEPLQQQQQQQQTSSTRNNLTTNGGQQHQPTGHKSCPAPVTLTADGKETVASVKIYGPQYDWHPSDKSLIFEAFFLMYVTCQIPGARLAEVLGAKWILATATIGSTIISMLSPWAAAQHVYLLALVRGLMGICQTALYPACYVLYTQWLPPAERRQALPVLSAGAYIGSIIASTSTGYFSEQESLGWPFAFYMPSVVCAIWSVVWIFYASSEPREHRFISLEEIDYIESRMEIKRSVAGANGSGDGAGNEIGTTINEPKKSPSWVKIFTSQHIWAMMFAFFASNWAFTITLLLLPSYLNDILLIPPFRNGLINSMIYILFCISSPIVGAVSSLMIETRACGLSHLQTRKLFQCVAIFSQAICFVSLPMIGCNTSVVLGVLYVQIVLFSFINGGEVQLPSELSLDFAGTIYAIGNCVGSSTGFLVPRVYSLIVKDSHDRDSWNTYFYVASTITTIGGLIFLIFGRNDLQDFSKDPEKPPKNSYPLSADKMSIGTNNSNNTLTNNTTTTRDKSQRKEIQLSI